MNPQVRRASVEDAGRLAPLFDRYRSFYGQPSDTALALDFLRQRLQHGESVVWMAVDGEHVLGFTQLFPSFSSVGARRIWVLNDLFVEATARRRGVARVLLDAAAGFARSTGAQRLELETEQGNQAARALYLTMGWTPYSETLRFRLALD